MAETLRLMKIECIDYLCDVCQYGYYRFERVVLNQFKHSCNNCGDVQHFNKCYPALSIMSSANERIRDI